MERKTSPFDDEVDEKGIQWISPKVIAEIGFTEWTGDYKLRHPRYIGLRPDKDPKQVVRKMRGKTRIGLKLTQNQ